MPRFFNPKGNKYRARKTEYNGVTYDSMFEAAVAARLDSQCEAGVVQSYDRQVTVKVTAFDAQGKEHLLCTHRVDFLMHMPDGRKILLEAKGVQTPLYKQKLKLLKTFYLPFHDYEYQIVTQDTLLLLNRS